MQNGVISRNIRTICKQWCSKNIFFRLRVLEAASSPTARKYSHMLSPSQVCGSAYSLFPSGASPKTVINCFIPRLPAASTILALRSVSQSPFLFDYRDAISAYRQRKVLLHLGTNEKEGLSHLGITK